jgi:heat shock protein HslJ
VGRAQEPSIPHITIDGVTYHKKGPMDIRRTISISVTWVLAALMAACTTAARSQSPAQGTALAGTEWALVSLYGNALIEGKQITLSFGEASIEGSGGCNTYGGSYTASKDSLHLSDVYWAEMACMEPEGVMEQEQAYFQALHAAASYRVAQDRGGDDRLKLYDEVNGQAVVLTCFGELAPFDEIAVTLGASE